MKLTLRIQGTHGDRVWVMTKCGTALVGRSSNAQLVIPSGSQGDLRVSHRHAIVEFNPPACRVYDLGSRNGSKLNGERIVVADLKTGDVLTLGRTSIEVTIEWPPAETVTFEDALFDDSYTSRLATVTFPS